MNNIVTAEYDAAENVLRLVAPLEGVADDSSVELTVKPTPAGDRWVSLRSTVSKEQLDELATIIDDMFPIER